MRLMIFASRHLSACCSPSFRLQSLLKLINLAQPLGGAGAADGDREHRNVFSARGVVGKSGENITGRGDPAGRGGKKQGAEGALPPPGCRCPALL